MPQEFVMHPSILLMTVCPAVYCHIVGGLLIGEPACVRYLSYSRHLHRFKSIQAESTSTDYLAASGG